MTTDPTFTAIFRRPGVEEPGRRITMEIGATGTRLSLDGDVLGTWANDAITFAAEPEPVLTISGEPWVLDIDDVAGFRAAAEARYQPGESPVAARDAIERDSSDDEPARVVDEAPGPVRAEASPIPWHLLTARPRPTTVVIASAAGLVLLAVSAAAGGVVSAVTGAIAGAAGMVAVLTWRGIAAAKRTRAHSSIGPDIDAEARVARAVAHAFSARTVTSTLEAQAMEELTLIKGIGPQYAQLLIEVGVRSVEALANITTSQRAALESALGRHSERVARERWVEQARRVVADRTRSAASTRKSP